MATEPIPLDVEGQRLFDDTRKRLGERLLDCDLPLLRITCKWLDRFNKYIDSDDKNADVKCGIATDKLLALASKFGLTPQDRKAHGDDAKPKKSERKRTALDELRPGKLKVHAG